MQQKSLLILSGVTVAALVAAAVSLRDKGATASGTERKLLFPDLKEHINELAQVHVEKAGKSVTLERKGATWALTDHGGYPAQVEKVKELAMRVAGLEIDEQKTAKKSNHAVLGVQWPPPEKAEGAEDGGGDPSETESGLITLEDGAGKVLASVVIGKSEWRGSKPKVYARRASEDQVYLCDPQGNLEATPDAKSWIDPKFLELANDRVQEVTIEHADGERLDIARSATNHTQFTLQGLAPGEKERYEGICNSVAQALGYGMQLDDVRPASEVDFNQEPLGCTTFRCVDGLQLALQTAKFEDKVWLKVAATYVPPPEPPAEESAAEKADEGAEGEAEQSPDEAEDKGAEKKDVGQEAKDLNERLSPWAFAIPSYRSDVLNRRRKELLADPPAAVGDDGGLQGVLDDMGIDDGESAAPVEPEPTKDDEGATAPRDDGSGTDESSDESASGGGNR